MFPSRDSELDNFKTQIDLRAYVTSAGFEYIRKQSSPHSSVMRHGNGDKLIITRNPNLHYVYFNVHGGDSGTVIDFVQSRERCSLGEVRKRLRSWTGSCFPSSDRPPLLFPELVPVSIDTSRVLASWMNANEIEPNNSYLTRERFIPEQVISAPVFRHRMKVDARGNVLFAHHNQSGLCGFELKNRGFTGFSPGGTKGLMFSHPRESDQTMVICETGIDLLSIAAIDGTDTKRFFSTAGQPSPAQLSLLQSAAQKMPSTPDVLLAFDNDESGRKMAGVLRSVLKAHCPTIVDHFPTGEGQDWNDVLQMRSGAVSPQLRMT